MGEPRSESGEHDGLAPGLSGGEKDEVEQRGRPRALVLHEAIRLEGEHELRREPSALFWSGLAAGLSMGFSLVAMAALRAALPSTRWSPLVVNLGYVFGFLVVIMGRQQLFTENTLTPVLPLLYHRDRKTLARMLRLWGVVLAANVVGAWLFAAVATFTSALSDDLELQCAVIGREAMEGGAGAHFLRGIMSGSIIALLVWVLPNAESSRAAMIVAFTYLVGVAGFSHVVVGTVEGAFAVLAGAYPLGSFVLHFFLPVLAGNVLGGSALVATIAHAQIISEAHREGEGAIASS